MLAGGGGAQPPTPDLRHRRVLDSGQPIAPRSTRVRLPPRGAPGPHAGRTHEWAYADTAVAVVRVWEPSRIFYNVRYGITPPAPRP